LVKAQEQCQPPTNQVAGITYLCSDGRCVSICDGDLAWPIDAPSSFECADYPAGDYPFATLCGQPCQPPQPGPSLVQQCTETHCSYSCDNGQFLTGPNEVYCNLQREWGSDLPVCRLQKQFCSDIPAPLLATCTDNVEFGSICDFSCKESHELIGAQNAECIYFADAYHWSTGDELPRCEPLDTGEELPNPIVTPEPTTIYAPTDEGDNTGDNDDDGEVVDCADGRFALACWRQPRNQIIIGCIGGGVLVLILIVVIIFCCIKKRNDSAKDTPTFFDENPTLQKSVRSSHADNDHIVAPNSYHQQGTTMGHSVPSNSFYRGPAAQRTQYAHRHEVSSPKRNVYGPYSKVEINPNRNNSEEGLPFINDPSNIDNFNDSSHYAGSSRGGGGGLAQNAHYDYGQQQQQQQQRHGQQPQMSTFFS